MPTLVHALTDGRDTPPRSSLKYIERLASAEPFGAGHNAFGIIIDERASSRADRRPLT